jgi:cysteinyl-tRNA synthetase
LGLNLSKEAEGAGEQSEDPSFVAEIEKLIEERKEAKTSKNYERADEIRKHLKEKGIILEDSPAGTSWKRS